MTNPSRGFHRVREIFPLEPKGDVDEADQYGHLQQGTDDSGKGLARVDPEDGHGYRNGKFEVIRCRREAQGC